MRIHADADEDPQHWPGPRQTLSVSRWTATWDGTEQWLPLRGSRGTKKIEKKIYIHIYIYIYNVSSIAYKVYTQYSAKDEF
jgi:hypothetical protein